MRKSSVNRRSRGVRASPGRKFIRGTLPAATVLILLLATIGALGTARADPLVCQTYVPVSASVTTNSTKRDDFLEYRRSILCAAVLGEHDQLQFH